MKKLEPNGVPIYKFNNLEGFPEISHGVFTRVGGFSKKPFNTLNIAKNVGDDPLAVSKNREVLRKNSGSTMLFAGNQVHGTDVIVLEEPPEPDRVYDGDALVTNFAGIGLMIQTADC